MYQFFILILSLAPWRPEYLHTLYNIPVIVHESPCREGAAWTGPDRAMHLCPASAGRWGWMGLHESQHIMASTYLGPTNFDIFSRVAMKSLYEGDYTEEQRGLAKYLLSYGGHELHAELPWITEGKLHPALQRWYPWFVLGHHGLVPLRKIPRGR